MARSFFLHMAFSLCELIPCVSSSLDEDKAPPWWLHLTLCCVLSHSVMSTLCDPMDCRPPGTSVYGDSPGKNLHWSGLPCPPPGHLPNPGVEPRSPTLQADSLPPEPPGKPMNTRVGNLSLLQGNFPTQESNQDLLHYRQILYQLSCQGYHFKGPVCTFSHVRLFGTPWTVAYQVPLSMKFWARILKCIAISFFRGFSDPGIKTTFI